MNNSVTIDGSQGEGGGQILRTSLSLSAITQTPFRMVNVRAKREVPGLKRQHLTCVRAVAEICGAQVEGDEAGSLALSFAPGPIRGGEYRFDVGTAGAATLVAQTVLPVLLKADAPSSVTITGGTHVQWAPIWEFFAIAYLPQLRAMGAEVEAELVHHGFYPAAGGEIRLFPSSPSKRPGRTSHGLSPILAISEVAVPSASYRTFRASSPKTRRKSSRANFRTFRCGRKCLKRSRPDRATAAWRNSTSRKPQLSFPRLEATTV